jgi:protein SCO1/2
MPRAQRLTPICLLVLVLAACSTGSANSGASTTVVPSVAPSAIVTAVLASEESVAATEGVAAPSLLGLVNADGSPFDLSTFSGSNTLLFFGYTHCPDVCPATIGELFGVFEAAPDTQAVFVSVDPERDTPEFMAEWTQYFPANFHAVTGSPGAIRRAADEYGVRYARVETSSQAGYTMSHTADLFLIDEQGHLSTTYPFGTSASAIVEDLESRSAG